MRGVLFGAAFLVLTFPATVAAAAETEVDAVLRDCGRPDLTRDQIDSCLERARVIDETSPSPRLQSLEAQLEQQGSGKAAGPAPAVDQVQATAAPPSAPDADMETGQAANSDAPAQVMSEPRYSGGGDSAEAAPGRDVPPPQMSDPDGDSHLSGPDAADMPPVADPPDESPDDRSRPDPDSPSQTGDEPQ